MRTKIVETHIIFFWASLALLSASLEFVHLPGGMKPVQRTEIQAEPAPVHALQKAIRKPPIAHSPSDPFAGAAVRLRSRMLAQGVAVPSVSIVAQALRQRSAFLGRNITLDVVSDGPVVEPIAIDVALHPEWLKLHVSATAASYAMDSIAVQESISQGLLHALPIAANASVSSFTAEDGVRRAVLSGKVARGYDIDTASIADAIVAAIHSDETHIRISAKYGGGTVSVQQPDGSTHILQLIATGKSNFDHSVAARQTNVLKAINEQVNGVVVRAGEKFSFNAILGGPVTLKKGWVEALGLFGGGAAMTPGGGICQAATTVYRAALLAGLPVLEHRSHSLYVSYYERYGVGMDATIFPGVQDLVFQNDTSDDLVLRAYTEGFDVYVQVFGKPDGRRVALEGPFFSTTQPKSQNLKSLARNEIGWVQHVMYSDGKMRSYPLVSQYQKGIPIRLRNEYPQAAMIANETPMTLALK